MKRSKCSGSSAQDNFTGIFDVRTASTEVNAQSMKDHESIFNNLILSFEHLDKLTAAMNLYECIKCVYLVFISPHAAYVCPPSLPVQGHHSALAASSSSRS